MTAYRQFARSTNSTPQTEPIPGRTDQVKNSAGGYVWELDKWGKLDRFLVMGTEGGTYYIKETELTRKNAEAVEACIKENGLRTVERIVEISESGRAAKNDPALFALALCMCIGDEKTKQEVVFALPKVARIGTHLFHFADYCNNMRGWGRTLKRAVASWYDNKTADSVGYQVVKYQSRNNWSHADLLKLAHPKAHPDIYNWIMRDKPGHTEGQIPQHLQIQGYEMAKKATDAKAVAVFIRDYKLPREAVPTQFLQDPIVWEALLNTEMGYEAMIRNLGNMGKVGLLKPMSKASKLIVERLHNEEALRKSRLHPIKILAALRTYGGGKGIKGSGEWDVVPQVVDALNDAFYASFGTIQPSGKNTMLALDVSGSMGSALPQVPFITCAEGTAVMAMVTARVEPNYIFMAFANDFRALDITASQRLDDVMKKISNINFGGTNCSLPMITANKKKWDIDTFVVYTDNETWAGNSHPSQELVKYRKEQNKPNAQLAVVGMTSNGFSIADPKDQHMLDFVGFDTNTPEAIATFQRS